MPRTILAVPRGRGSASVAVGALVAVARRWVVVVVIHGGGIELRDARLRNGYSEEKVARMLCRRLQSVKCNALDLKEEMNSKGLG